MEFKNLEKDKEIADLIKHIEDINEQLEKPTNEGIRKVIKDVQNTIQKETISYELSQAQGKLDIIKPIDDIDINVLYNKLTDYKLMCKCKLIEKCGQEFYVEIEKKYNLR